MKLIVQIPCYNEADNLPEVLNSIPKEIEGISSVEVLVIDDGSSDGTSALAKELGVEHIIRSKGNRGLAKAFHTGLEESLRLGADIIVNTDGDNQYQGEYIRSLVSPVLQGDADIVVGDRGGYSNEHFSFSKRTLQVFGSYVIAKITGLDIKDAVSGFRAMSRQAAQQINIVSDFSYTIEMLIQASVKRLRVVSVPVRTNGKTRESRLFNSIPQFLQMSVTTLLRMYTMYRPLRVFFVIGVITMSIGLFPIFRFLYLFFTGAGEGHIQSLILGSTLFMLGFITLLIGVVADLVNFNRKLMEKVLLRVERQNDNLDRLEQELKTKNKQ